MINEFIPLRYQQNILQTYIFYFDIWILKS